MKICVVTIQSSDFPAGEYMECEAAAKSLVLSSSHTMLQGVVVAVNPHWTMLSTGSRLSPS